MTYEHLNSVPCKDFQGGCSQGNLSEVLYSILIRGPSTAAMDGPAGPVTAADMLAVDHIQTIFWWISIVTDPQEYLGLGALGRLSVRGTTR